MPSPRGYISQALHDLLFAQGLELLTKIRKNMKNRLMRWWDKLLLRKRALIESINDQLKNISQIEHTRHRSAQDLWSICSPDWWPIPINRKSPPWGSSGILYYQ